MNNITYVKMICVRLTKTNIYLIGKQNTHVKLIIQLNPH